MNWWEPRFMLTGWWYTAETRGLSGNTDCIYHSAPFELESPIKLIVSIIVLNADLSLFSKKFTSIRLIVELKILLLTTTGAAAKSLQSCPTLCNPIDGSLPGSPVLGILQARKNTGVGCHFLLQCMKVKSESRVRLLATPWTAAHQAPPSMGFSRQEYWSVVPCPSLVLTTSYYLLSSR